LSHPVHRVTAFRIVGPFVLDVSFADGMTRRIDFGPVLEGEIYGPLRDRALFECVAIDPEACTLVWPNGADFDPSTLHDWPEGSEALAAAARGWKDRSGRPSSDGG
jgi:hypothetical protein